MCNSACPYLILGAAAREIAPNTVLAVHSPKVILSIRGKPSEKQRAEAVQRGMERANRIVAVYLARMGIDRGLLDLAKTVKFESPHVLARDEIFRFGIDRREFVETPWQFENAGRAFVSKIAIARTSDGATFRTTQLRLFCDGKDRARLMLVREFDKSAIGTSSVALIANSEKPLTFAVLPRVGGFEIRSAAIASDELKNFFRALDRRARHGKSPGTLKEGRLRPAPKAIPYDEIEACFCGLRDLRRDEVAEPSSLWGGHRRPAAAVSKQNADARHRLCERRRCQRVRPSAGPMINCASSGSGGRGGRDERGSL
jgi:hypothetical protein